MQNTTRRLHVVTIREYATHKGMLTDDIISLIAQANSDLYNGPGGSDDSYPGFDRACTLIREALSEIGDVWVTPDGCIFDIEPDWTTEDPSDYTRYESRWAKQAIVGAELVSYVA